MKVISKQKNSKMCYVCGLQNPAGLKCHFYNMEDGSVMTKFQYREEHQSYPQRVHGGLIATVLDELACRAYWVENPDDWCVTMSMEVKYRKPLPYNEDIYGKGIVKNDLSKFFTAEVELKGSDDTVYASAIVKYLKLKIENITDKQMHDGEEMYLSPDNVTEL